MRILIVINAVLCFATCFTTDTPMAWPKIEYPPSPPELSHVESDGKPLAKPSFVQIPEGKTVVVNQRVQFFCESIGNPAPTMSWIYNGKSLQFGDRDPMGRYEATKDGTLRIIGVKYSDPNEFVCRASNQEGTIEARFSLTVVDVYGCPRPRNKWQEVGNYSFQINTEEMGYKQAAKKCKSQGGYLVEIKNADVEKQLRSIVQRGMFWIGVRRRRTYQSWEFINGEKVKNYQDFARGEPNNAKGNEKCVEIWATKDKLLWNDEACYEKRQFICQKERKSEDKFTRPKVTATFQKPNKILVQWEPSRCPLPDLSFYKVFYTTNAKWNHLPYTKGTSITIEVSTNISYLISVHIVSQRDGNGEPLSDPITIGIPPVIETNKNNVPKMIGNLQKEPNSKHQYSHQFIMDDTDAFKVQPQDVSATILPSNKLKVTWNIPDTQENIQKIFGIKIYYSRNDYPWEKPEPIVIFGNRRRSIMLDGFPPWDNNDIWIKAFNHAGCDGPPSEKARANKPEYNFHTKDNGIDVSTSTTTQIKISTTQPKPATTSRPKSLATTTPSSNKPQTNIKIDGIMDKLRRMSKEFQSKLRKVVLDEYTRMKDTFALLEKKIGVLKQRLEKES